MARKRQFEFQEGSTTGIRVAGRRLIPEGPALFSPGEKAVESASSSLFLKRQSPPMSLKDEVIFLLHTAAEIEHSLMVQYLYSAFSLPTTTPHRDWYDTLLRIAIEEMGHLMAVQNMLLALGAPLNFEREDFRFNSFYPFPFRLEPFSIQSMAKYVLAEMPERDQIPQSLGFDPNEVTRDAGVADGQINRVGALFNTLEELARMLTQPDLNLDSKPFQAAPEEWRASHFNLALDIVAGITGSEGLVDLIQAIGEQGEGPTLPPEGNPSHFLRFFGLYRNAKQRLASHGPASLANAVPIDPTVIDSAATGYLAHAVAFAWGDVLNHRFRWLFASIGHYLSTDQTDDRAALVQWCFKEMRHLREIAGKLARLPQHDPPQADPFNRPRIAGAPFEVPYTIALPMRPIDRWRHHKMLVAISLEQLGRIPGNDLLAASLRAFDQDRLTLIEQKIQQTKP